MSYPIIKVKDTSGERFKYSRVATIYSAQNCKCFYCGKFMQYMSFRPDMPSRSNGFTIDHLFPRSLGFGLYGNAVLACRRCNEKKGDRPPTPVEIVRAWEIYNRIGLEFVATIIFP